MIYERKFYNELNMEITKKLLAAYAEGKVSAEERSAVRQYLIDNPEELETVAMLMDKDYDLKPPAAVPKARDALYSNGKGMVANVCYGAVAFSPQKIPLPKKSTTESQAHVQRKPFSQCLDELLDEMDL